MNHPVDHCSESRSQNDPRVQFMNREFEVYNDSFDFSCSWHAERWPWDWHVCQMCVKHIWIFFNAMLTMTSSDFCSVTFRCHANKMELRHSHSSKPGLLGNYTLSAQWEKVEAKMVNPVVNPGILLWNRLLSCWPICPQFEVKDLAILLDALKLKGEKLDEATWETTTIVTSPLGTSWGDHIMAKM